MSEDDDIPKVVNETVKEAVRRGRWEYSKPPLEILVIILMAIGVYSIFYGHATFFVVTPDVLFISAAIILFFGAFYDFGAHTYQKDLNKYHRKTVTESDAKYINKQQLIMTIIYIGIGGLYVATGIIIYFISLYL